MTVYNPVLTEKIPAHDNMLLQYSLHEPRRGRDDIRAFNGGLSQRHFLNLKLLGGRGSDR